MTCLHSSDGMDDTWTRKPSPTARWLLISPEWRKGMSNMVCREVVLVGLCLLIPLLSRQFSCFKLLSFSILTHLWVWPKAGFHLWYIQWLLSVLRAWWGPWPLRSCWKACLFCRLRLTHSWSSMWVRLWHDFCTYLTEPCSIAKTEVSLLFLSLRFIPRSWTMGSSMLHFCSSSRTWSNCLHPTTTESSTY